jgi:transposase
VVSTRAQMILWASEGLGVADVPARAGTSRPTVYKWLDRYEEGGLAALNDRKSTGRPRSIDTSTRARIIALTKASPPGHAGLTHWSSYEMSKFLRRHEGISVSHTFVAGLWRQNGLRPHRQGTSELSTDPDFTAKVPDVVGLYLDPPAGAVTLSFDEKTQVQAQG